jgi:peptide/nickel transport system permease protein
MTRTLRLVALRAASAIPTLFLVAIGVFLLIRAAPGDAVDAYLAQTGGDLGFAADLRRRLGLDASPLQQFAGFLLGVVTLDFGKSMIFGRPVFAVVLERLPNTLMLMATTAAFAAGIGVALGLAAGARPESLRDRTLSGLAFLLLAMPNFWLALLLILGFVVTWPLFPIGGIATIGAPRGGLVAVLDTARHLVLPTVALGAGYVALYLRTLRAGMVETWPHEHVRSARARGLPRRRVVWRAVARPALLPVAAVLGQNVGTLIGGSVVVETVFAIPGMGRLAFEAVTGRDAPLLAGVVMSTTLLVILVNLLVDLAMTRLDPRIGATDG